MADLDARDRPRQCRVGVDIGGTFTDLCLLDEQTEQLRYLKIRSTAEDPAAAVLAGVGQLLAESGFSASQVSYFAHGTTVATNALIQRRGARTGLITTAGFRDLLELARQKRSDLYDLQVEKPRPLVPRDLVQEVQERTAYDGQILRPLDEADVLQAARTLIEQGVQAIAICLIHAYANPEHERCILDCVQRSFPETYVAASHLVLREFREYERLSTTVVNAYIGPVTSSYLNRLESGLADLGVPVRPHVSASSGGVMSVPAAVERPVALIASGPAAGVAGAVHVAQLSDRRNLLTMDIGGTSVDVCLIRDQRPSVATQTQASGLPIKLSMIDVHSVGAGGGSIAWIDHGLLKVGPHSAGADPGPACYGLGGEHPTVTDAQLALGRLESRHLLAGRLPLDPDRAQTAIERQIARPLGLSVTEAARGIVAVMEANLIRALRRISVERGHDPREFSLVAFGGAGPLHAAAVARELGIAEVLIPEHPGLLCAIGLLTTDIRADFSLTRILGTDDADPADVRAIFAELEADAHRWLEREGIRLSDRRLIRAVDMRYVGQNHELTIGLPDGEIGARTLSDLAARFHQSHELAYGHHAGAEPTQVVNHRVTAIGVVPKVRARSASPIPRRDRDRPLAPSSRPVYFHESNGFVKAAILSRDDLWPGDRVAGPAIVEQMDSTTVIPPGVGGRVDAGGSLIIDTSVGG